MRSGRSEGYRKNRRPEDKNHHPYMYIESCQKFGGRTVLQIEAVRNLRKVHMYLNAYYPGPTGEFTGSSVGHNYLRKNGMHLRIVALNRSLRDLSIGV